MPASSVSAVWAHVGASSRPAVAKRAVWAAEGWAVVFVAVHGYWALGGRLGFGDQAAAIPMTTSSLAGWVFTIVVAAMFIAGLAVPLALVQRWGRRVPRRLLLGLMWAGALFLTARGGLGLFDDLLRQFGVDGGLTGLSYQQTLGTARPTAYTLWSSAAIDLVFVSGGVLFTRASQLLSADRRTGARS